MTGNNRFSMYSYSMMLNGQSVNVEWTSENPHAEFPDTMIIKNLTREEAETMIRATAPRKQEPPIYYGRNG